MSHALTSLSPEEMDARGLGLLWADRWDIENRSFWVRDVLFHEDAYQVRGVGAQVLAALEALSFYPLSALRFLGLYAV